MILHYIEKENKNLHLAVLKQINLIIGAKVRKKVK